MKEAIITSILFRFEHKKKKLLRGVLSSSSIIWDWYKVWPLKLKSVSNRLKLKIIKWLILIPRTSHPGYG